MKFSSIFCLLGLLVSSYSIHTIAHKSIKKSEVPDVQPSWSGIADFSPKLRAVESAEFSNNGMSGVSRSKFGYEVMFWNVPDGTLVWTHQQESEVDCETFYRLSDLEVPCPRIENIDFTNGGRLMLTSHEDRRLIAVYMMLSNMEQQQAGIV